MVAEEFLDNGGSHHTHLGGLLDVLFRKTLALLDGPQTDVQIVYRLTIHRGVGIVVAIDSLTGGSDLRRHFETNFFSRTMRS